MDGEPHDVPISSREHAQSLDAQDPLSHLKEQFLIPSKGQLKAESLQAASRDSASADGHDSENSIYLVYLCGNSLGPQPKLVATRLQQHLNTWSSQGVFGHFKALNQSPLPTWLDADAKASESIAPIVGAHPDEVAVMQTLTANLHFLMSAFYKPDITKRHKIILETKAFPSDHFVVETQIRHHNLNPETSMITISPPTPETPLTTDHIISILDANANDTALLLLPGIQFYTGQFLNIPLITAHARSLGIFTLWDLAHAVGNVPLQLHDWDVDAAVWCTYKYLNSGPGTIGGLFAFKNHLFKILTPSDPEQRGAQLSLQLVPGLLHVVMRELVLRSVVVDERQPDVVRVAPAPLFNSFEDCWVFVDAFAQAIEIAVKAKENGDDGKKQGIEGGELEMTS
ncbi:putative Kynureninase 1 [Glarea lozoyensis 74030]|uniref:Kynureninase n=1 Tax=Glarea lozoyensis (strain ATCC 74030 / MF5533) TaxID=1104152 RepID=H0EIC1_GLAL7|nr:putative Kynureninase 1 [Glarea lozoyensis 74030]